MTLLRVNLANLKVLVVDDSRTARTMLNDMLREMGVGSVAKAEDGADAIKTLKDFPADIAICDLHMAPLDGIEFTRLLRSADDSPNPYLPVLMLTGDATQTQLNNAMNAGVHSFMSKPLQADALLRQIKLVLSRPLVFVREGRDLKPLSIAEAAARGSRASCGTAGLGSQQEQAEVHCAGTA